MKGWIRCGINLVLIGEYDLAVFDQQRAKGFVAMRNSLLGETDSLIHESFVLRHAILLICDYFDDVKANALSTEYPSCVRSATAL